MKVKTIWGIIAAIFALVVVILGGTTIGIVVIILAAISLHEFYSVFEQKGHKPVKWVGYLYLILIPFIVFGKVTEPFSITIKATGSMNLYVLLQFVIFACLLSTIVFKFNKHNVVDIALTVFGGYYAVILISYFLLLRYMDKGVYLFFTALVGTVSGDTFALIFGMLWGKKKLIPEVSPKKTVMGSIGAFAGALVFVTAYGIIINAIGVVNIPIYHFAILSILLGGACQIGDLTASAMKRYTGVKDFGKLIPGHGGVLDRIDSLLFCVPIVYYYMRLVVFGG